MVEVSESMMHGQQAPTGNGDLSEVGRTTGTSAAAQALNTNHFGECDKRIVFSYLFLALCLMVEVTIVIFRCAMSRAEQTPALALESK